MTIKHLVMFSGGIGSWAAAKRVVDRHGIDGVVLLFADTLAEDADLYRFIDEAAANVGAPLVKIAEGRTPWQVFFDGRFIGNSRVDLCSRVLKRELLAKWRDEHCNPETTTIYLGIDWTEKHRLDRFRARNELWTTEAPMCEPPWMSKRQVMSWLEREGVAPPRLYGMGFPHNNCGGACVKAGHAQWQLLLAEKPELYAEWEANEQKFRNEINPGVSILRDRVGGVTTPLTLAEFRERIEAKAYSESQQAQFDWGGCGCAID